MNRDHAIIIGGSIGGMLVARVLSEHFKQVTLIEHDELNHQTSFRPGVPQARHLHALLTRGLLLIEELFPGFQNELVLQGTSKVRHGTDFRILYPSGWNPPIDTGMFMYPATRPLIENTMRLWLRTYTNIAWRTGERALSLIPGPKSSVTGVRVISGDLTADLIVDASGRNSRSPRWLTDLGFSPPAETIVDARWGYASRLYRRPVGMNGGWKALLSMPKPPDHFTAGIMQPVEDWQWLVTLAGVVGRHPPTDETGFLEFARNLRTPLIYEAIRNAEPLTPIHGYRRTANVRRYYERLDLWPEGFIVLGDALCAFNPVYGQGMSVCAIEAMSLRRALEQPHRQRFCQTFQRSAARIVDGPWMMATGEDLRWPETTGGERSFATRFMHRYLDRVIGRLPEDPATFRRFGRVTHMMAPAASLFHPSVLWKVAIGRPKNTQADTNPLPHAAESPVPSLGTESTPPSSSLPAAPRSARAS